jgi:hypothetical protein
MQRDDEGKEKKIGEAGGYFFLLKNRNNNYFLPSSKKKERPALIYLKTNRFFPGGSYFHFLEQY